MQYWQVVLIAIIEGLTEFLPVSSTGHIILSTYFLGISPTDFVKLFTVAIQLGAILSVVLLYFPKFIKSFGFYFKLLVAFLPAAALGFLLNETIDALLENVWVVTIMLLLGGVILLFVDRWFNTDKPDVQEVSYSQSWWIGWFQLLALIPGVSRSAATIIGGLQQGLNRKQAAEFSFFLAVPTMLGATIYKLLKYFSAHGKLSSEEINLLVLGNVVAFIVAAIAIKTFIAFLSKNGFKVFGYYRIAVGLALLIFLLSGAEINLL